MKQRFFILLALGVLLVVLVGLNAASYVQKEEQPDTEFYPNRSTYHPGATGTRAFYELLAETDRKPLRWQEKPSALLYNTAHKPQTFVVIGELRREFTDEEIEQLLRWVAEGGKLVVIDRTPRADLISTTANWKVSAVATNFPPYDLDPSLERAADDRKNERGAPAAPDRFHPECERRTALSSGVFNQIRQLSAGRDNGKKGRFADALRLARLRRRLLR
jgi:hypothetical protein